MVVDDERVGLLGFASAARTVGSRGHGHRRAGARLAIALLRQRPSFTTVPDGQRDWVTHSRELIAKIA